MIASGSQHQLALVQESAFATTPATPAFKKLRHNNLTGGLSRSALQSGELRSDRQIVVFRSGNKNVALDIPFELSHNSFDELFEAWAMGTWAGNILKAGVTHRSFTLERYFADIDKYIRYQGCKVNTFSLSIRPDAMVTGNFGLVGAGGSTDTVAIAGSSYTATNTNDVFDSFSGTINEGGSPIAVITALDISGDNGIRNLYVVGSDSAIESSAGRSNVTGTVTAFFEDITLLNKFINGTASSIDVTIGDGVNTMQIEFPNIKYTGGDVPTNGEGEITISMPFQGLYDGTSLSNIVFTRSA